MKQFLREYFTFNKSERNGIFILLIIICLQLLYLGVSPYFLKKNAIDFSDSEKQTAAFNYPVKSVYKHKTEPVSDESFGEESSIDHYFEFDPNITSDTDWKNLGLSNKQIKTINNYKSKGGKFFKKEDLKKIYGISETQYLQLEPYIEIAHEKTQVTVPVKNKSIHLTKVNINTADSLQLVALKGIGPFYAKSILNYREQLGGFYSANQLLEVWKFDTEKLNEIIGDIEVDSSAVNKININTCAAQQLKHPYLKWNQVNAIINYRKKHGAYNSVDEIKNTSLISEETYHKIIPYLTIQ